MPPTVVVHCQRQPYDVYIGRPSDWGNPFSHVRSAIAKFHVSTRVAAIQSFARWIKDQPALMARLHELKGKRLGCWCAPLPCHGDVLAALADALPEDPDVSAG